MKTTQSWRSFEGTLSVHEHDGGACGPMTFAAYRPLGEGPFPVLWYLSGLTCDWSNAGEKAGMQRVAAALGLMLILPDTSPRGPNVPDDEAYDLGQGAGFYVDATEAPWAERFRMRTYVTETLPEAVFAEWPEADRARQGVLGHSMGGHGALTLHLSDPDTYRSCSALAPVSSPSAVPWGQKAFSAYLGEDRTAWAAYDAETLVRRRPTGATILIDTGTDDPFLEEQLRPARFEAAARESGQRIESRLQEGYDHSYHFVSSVIEAHLHHHAAALNGS